MGRQAARQSWSIAMPTSLPTRSIAQARKKAQAMHAKTQAKVLDNRASAEFLRLWTLSMGSAALGAAVLAYSTTGDNTGAASILVGAAMVVSLVLYQAERR
jgi:hypothetical protein